MPKNLNLDIVDEVELVSSDEAFEMARKVSLEEGVLAGISTGATITAAIRVSQSSRNGGQEHCCHRCQLWRALFDHSSRSKSCGRSYGCSG